MARQIFISYARDDLEHVRSLHDDLTAAGFEVFFDLELTGGQSWWDSLLERIRRCDVFVPVVTTKWLESAACKLETGYANDVGRAVLPIFFQDGLSRLLPADLAAKQGVRLEEGDRRALLHLVADLNALPEQAPLPDPLPQPPAAPISYLTALHEKVATPHETSRRDQELLLAEFRRRLGSGEDRAELAILLRRFRRRDDLNVHVAEAIDALLDSLEPEPRTGRDPSREREYATSAAGGSRRDGTTAAGSRTGRSSPKPDAAPEPVRASTAPASPPPGKTKLTWSYVLAAIGVFFFPIVLGPIAMYLAHQAGKEGNPRSQQAMRVAITATIVGIILGAIVLSA